jgi:superfamily I DNA/RNA helicase
MKKGKNIQFTKTVRDKTNESIEDGRTLLYVGVSRAKAVLVVLHNWKPSMFIQTLKAVNS